MNETTNKTQPDDIKKLIADTDEMDFHRWAQVIDSLENAISESRRSIAINGKFLLRAIEEQKKHDKPE